MELVEEACVLVPGRLVRATMRVRADDTRFTLLAAYMPPQSEARTARRQTEWEDAWTALEEAVATADAHGESLLIGGDLNAQHAVALEHWGSQAGDSDERLEDLSIEYGITSASEEVEATYVQETDRGSVRSTIDHWLVSEGLRGRVRAEVGPGVDGLRLGAGYDAASGSNTRKGHNSVALTLRLQTDAGREAEGLYAKRGGQVRPLDEAEMEAFAAEEEAEVEAALAAVGEAGGGDKERMEAIDEALHALARRIVGISEAAQAAAKNSNTKEDQVTRKDRKMRNWRRLMRRMERMAPSDGAMHESDARGIFGRLDRMDPIVKAAVQGWRGERRRQELLRMYGSCSKPSGRRAPIWLGRAANRALERPGCGRCGWMMCPPAGY